MKNLLPKSIIYLAIISVAVINGKSYSQTTVSFNFTGNVQSWTVPPCVTSISVTMAGADGGGTSGGNGAVISGTLAVTPGQVLNIYVGGTGTCNTNSGGGWNGGGTGKAANSSANGSCGGGGATDIRIGGTALANRVMVAAGGGGMGGGTQDAAGGVGGCASGATGVNSFGGGGTGGTQTSGGAGGTPWGSGQNGAPGSLGNGGAGATDNCYNNSPGGGGGGGYYGGGSGGADCFSSAPYGGGGGGGGSSLTPAGGTCTQGSNNGPGYVIITYTAGTATALPTNTGPYCVGQTIQLNAGGTGSSYAWTGPNGFSSTAQNPTLPATIAAAGTYTVTVTNAGCTAIGTTTVVVNNNPIVDAGADQTVCSGTNVTLSATGATTYTWDNGVTQGVAFAPAVGTVTYTVTGTTSGCTGTDQVVVTVNPIPTVNAGTDVSICSAGSTTLTATGATTYSWSPGGQTTASITVSPASTTTYTVTGTSNGCSSSDVVTVTVLSNAPINAGVDVSICEGQSTTLTATGGTQYVWSPGGEITANITVSPISTTTYTVNGTDANGCLGADQVTVTVNPLPVVNAGLDQTVCSGTSVTLTGSGATNYTWDNGISQGVSFTPSVGTINYTVTGTTAAGCTSTDQVTVTVNPNPVTNAGTDQTVCAGTSVTLTATGASTYSWDNAVNQGVAFVPISTNTYTVTGTNSYGCTSTDQVMVTVNPLPVVNAGADQTVCAGTSVTLSASGASTYTWDNGVSQGVAFTPAVGSITYSVTGTSGVGCISSDQVVVTVNANPLPVINGPTEYCVSDPPVLSTSTAYTTYNWSTGATSATVTVTAADNPVTVTVTNAAGCSATSSGFSVIENTAITTSNSITICQGESALIHGVNETVAGTYSQTYTAVNGCDSISNVTLTVNALPAVNAGIDQSVCTGTSVTLSATGASTYTWNNAVQQGVPFVPAIGNNTYTVSGTSAQGCVNTDQVLVTVYALPSISAGPDIAVCTGTSVTLSGSGGVSYAWNNGVSDGVSFVPSMTTTYTVTGTDINGCVNNDQVVVTVNANAIISAGSDVVVCQGETVTLNGSGGVSYTWDNGVVNGVSFTPSASGTYNVTGTNVNGCTGTDQVNVTVNPLPTVDAGTDKAICFGATVILQATGAIVYSWDNGVQQGVPFTPQVGSVTYTVTGTDANGCVNSDQVVVTVYALPSINAGADQAICAGETVVLNGTGGVAYAWNNGVTDGVSFMPSSTMTYTLTGTDSNGCINSDQVNVVVNALPNVNAGSNVVACENDNIILTASGANTYSWSGGVQNGQSFVPPVGTTIYTVTGTTAQGCVGQDQLTVTINPAPIVTFTIDQTLGCTPFTSTLINTTPNSSNCVWQITNGFVSSNCSSVSAEFLQGGCFDVTLTTTVNGCTGTFTAPNFVCAEETPNASIAAVPNTVTTMDSEVQFINNTIGADNYVWDFGDNTSESQEFEPSHIYPTEEEGGYNVMMIASSPLGCVDTAYTFVQVIEELIYYVPNSFTPDGDIFNQTWQPIFTSGFDPYDFTVLVFNRWGEIVWESHDHNEAWDGGYGTGQNYQMCQDGTYTWRIEFKTRVNDERKVITGHVSLIR